MSSPIRFVRKIFISFCQSLMGTAKLQHNRITDVFKGILGRIFQAVAMTFFPIPSVIRVFLQRMRGVRIGKKVYIGPGCYLDSTRPNLLEIEDLVSLAGRITILTHSSPTEPIRNILGDSSTVFKKVIIKRGTFVGMNCVILPGVIIGENSVMTAGSIILKNVPPYSVVAGNPARVVGRVGPLDKTA